MGYGNRTDSEVRGLRARLSHRSRQNQSFCRELVSSPALGKGRGGTSGAISECSEGAQSASAGREEGAGRGAGDLDTPAFRYSIETGQNPDDPAEYIIRCRLELRQGWPEHRAAIDEVFDTEFERLVIEFESMDETFDELVDKLEDVQDEQGGTLTTMIGRNVSPIRG